MPCPPVSFESATATSTDAGISSRQSNRNRQNSCSLVKTVSKSATFLVGTLPMLNFGDRLPSRWVLVGTFAAIATGLGGISCDPSAAVLGICFGPYALVYEMQSPLDFSLPNQLFPTAVRATAVGIVLAVSSVASVVVATRFLLLLQCCDVLAMFVLGTGIVLAGFFIALWPHIARFEVSLKIKLLINHDI